MWVFFTKIGRATFWPIFRKLIWSPCLQAAIVVYDITNADTFARAKTWVRELQRQAR
jgi:hypothetical protein